MQVVSNRGGVHGCILAPLVVAVRSEFSRRFSSAAGRALRPLRAYRTTKSPWLSANGHRYAPSANAGGGAPLNGVTTQGDDETIVSSPPATTTKTERRRDIQGLRGIAVLVVVAFHAHWPLPGGYVGVDMFFVISGFVITSLLVREVSRSGRINFGN